MRAALLLVLAGVLAALAAAVVRIDTDARAMLGDGAPAVQFLDQAEGRMVNIALRHPNEGRAAVLAEDLAEALSTDPLVSEVVTPSADLTGLTEFLWTYRYALAPPEASSWKPGAMAQEFAMARSALTGIGSGGLAGQYMLDPSGSFRRLVSHLVEAGLGQHVSDPAVALVVLRLSDAPFAVAAQSAFNERVGNWAIQAGASALVLGPRPISARVSEHIAVRSVWAMVAGTLLLLGWLAWAFRSLRTVAMTFLPLVTGFAGATLLVQLVFDSVHVLAFGFGGALLGLALDYPIHLVSHTGSSRAHAVRCVRLGAGSTAIAFGALATAGVPALAQVGVFVAAGLLVTAAASLWLVPSFSSAGASLVLSSGGVRFPMRRSTLGVVLALSVGGLLLLPERPAEALAPPPPDVLEDMAELRRIMDLPSGRYVIEVTGENLADLVVAQERLRSVLSLLVEADAMARADMLTNHLPQRQGHPELIDPEELASRLPEAMAEAGLDPAFADRIVSAYTTGLEAARSLPETTPGPAQALLNAGPHGLSAPVRLWQVADPWAVSAAIAEMNHPRIRFIDRQSWIAEGVTAIRANALRAVSLGLLAALVLLVLTTGHATTSIALATGAATAFAALATGVLFGGLGVFQIMALILVVGIGIDYGLLLTLGHDGNHDEGVASQSLGSILLCAGSTVLVFAVMAFSGVNILAEIGATVVIGVSAMVFMALWRAEGRA